MLRKIMFLTLSGIALLLAASALVPSAEAGHKRPAHVVGTVVAVDVDGSTLTLAPKHRAEDLTLNVTDATKIVIDGEDGTLAEIAIGNLVRARFDRKTQDAISLRVLTNPPQPAKVRGTVTAVDQDAATVTITPEEGDAVTLNITQDTKLVVNGEPAALADVQVGMGAHAHYNAATMNARHLVAGDIESRPAKIRGTVTAVDLNAATVTITPAEGDAVTLNITDETKIFINHHSAALADVVVGSKAVARYDADTLNAQELVIHKKGNH